MFDPTAFDNMKVVIEGTLYDRDLDGEIAIIDRNDIVNSAKMSRTFNISFTFPEMDHGHLYAQIEINAALDNLAAELLASSLSEKLAGCYVTLKFFIKHADDLKHYQAVQKIFLDIWGETRKMTQTVEYNPLTKPPKIQNVVTIDFVRLIREEQMEDLVEMTEFMIVTLEELKNYISGNK